MNATHIYQVPSRTVPGRTYQVDLERGACNCTAGGFGSACYHLGEAARMEREAMTQPEIDSAEAVREAERMTGNSDMWAKLREPFPPEQINQLPRGRTMLDYVGHAAVTDRLLRVDPLWNWEPVAFDAAGLPAFTTAGGKPIGLWIKLTVGGVTRLGYGSVTPEAYDPEKQLIGDALRNAAMRFGVALDLWSKSDLQAHDDDGAGTQMDAPPRRTPASYEAHRAGTQMDNGPRQGPAAEGDGYKQVTLLMGSERITSRHIAAVIGEFGKAQVEEWLSAEPGRTPAILIDYARAKRDQDETRRGGKVFE